MAQRLRIGVSRYADKNSVVAVRRVSIRERLLTFLLGKKKCLTIIVPGDSVRELSISEFQKEGV